MFYIFSTRITPITTIKRTYLPSLSMLLILSNPPLLPLGFILVICLVSSSTSTSFNTTSVTTTLAYQQEERFFSSTRTPEKEKEETNTSTSQTRLNPRDIIYSTSRNTVPIVNEEYKTIFFQVAKVASSQWTRFFMRLEGNPEWCSNSARMHDRQINKLTFLSDYSVTDAEEMMKSSEWTKAVFVRNPKPRILSAFLDKAVVHSDHFGNFTCTVYGMKGGNMSECVEKHHDFSFFLLNITTSLNKNVHWRSIYSRIDEKWWPFINFVGYMEHLSTDTRKFLQSIRSSRHGKSAWDFMGKTGWGDDERDCHGGNSSFLGERDNHHQTNARNKMIEYYTPNLERFVEYHYADDFNNHFFHFDELHLFPYDRNNGEDFNDLYRWRRR